MRVFSGQRAWLLQRASALVVLIALAGGAVTLLVGPPIDYEAWRAWATSPVGAVLVIIAFAALCAHGWVGARDIVLDYVHPRSVRLPLLTLIALTLFAVMLYVVITLITR